LPASPHVLLDAQNALVQASATLSNTNPAPGFRMFVVTTAMITAMPLSRTVQQEQPGHLAGRALPSSWCQHRRDGISGTTCSQAQERRADEVNSH
jgi:hypothetical protein